MSHILDKPTDDPNYRYRYVQKSNGMWVDLLEPTIQNDNPWDIKYTFSKESSLIQQRWSLFISYISSLGFNTKDYNLNSDDWISKTDSLVKDFNEKRLKPLYDLNPNEFGYKPFSKENDIKKIQSFSEITDEHVLVDGYLGTQTFQLKYPEIVIPETKFLTEPQNGNTADINPDPSLWVPVTWGKYRFVVKNSILLANYKAKNKNYVKYDGTIPSKGTQEYKYATYPINYWFEPYNPEIHTLDKLTYNPDGNTRTINRVLFNGTRTFRELPHGVNTYWQRAVTPPSDAKSPGLTGFTVVPNASKINLETAKNQLKQKVVETEDKIRSAISNVKKSL